MEASGKGAVFRAWVTGRRTYADGHAASSTSEFLLCDHELASLRAYLLVPVERRELPRWSRQESALFLGAWGARPIPFCRGLPSTRRYITCENVRVCADSRAAKRADGFVAYV